MNGSTVAVIALTVLICVGVAVDKICEIRADGRDLADWGRDA